MFGFCNARGLGLSLLFTCFTAGALADVPWKIEDAERAGARTLKMKVDWVPNEQIPFWFQYDPELGVKYGVSQDLEFRMKFTSLLFSDPQTNTLSGLADPKFGFKYQVSEGRNGEVLALDYLITPAKSGGMMNLDQGKHALALIGGWQSGSWELVTQSGFEISAKSGYDTPELFGGVLAIYHLDDKRAFGVEVFGHGGRGSGSPGEMFWAVGTQQKLSKDLAFEGRYSAGFNGRPDELFAGLRWRLPNP